MRRVLVTGSTGLVGRPLLPLLVARGYEVHTVARRQLAETPAGVTFHACDLLDHRSHAPLMARVQPEALIHLAWYTRHGRFWSAAENLDWVAASLGLLRAFADHGGRRFVGAGTCAEYAWTEPVLTEDRTPLEPRSLYGVSKDALHRIVSSFSAERGLSYAWGRIFFMYGGDEDPARLVPSVVRALRKGEPARCTHGTQVRDFMHVEDVARAFVHLLESKLNGPCNIGSGEPRTVRSIVEAIGAALGRPDLLHFGAIEPPPDDPPSIVASTARLRDQIGFRPTVPLADGIARILAESRGMPE